MPHRLHRPESLRALVRDMITKAGWTEARGPGDRRPSRACRNLSGHDSHGVGMIPLYFQSLADGTCSRDRQPQARSSTRALPASSMAGSRSGSRPRATPSSARPAMAQGWRRRHRQPAGRPPYRPDRPLCRGRCGGGADLVLLGQCRGPSADRAPYAAKEARFGTNPHAIGIPVPDGEPIILDFATSRMAHGEGPASRSTRASRVPPGYIIDGEGQPTTDPAHVFRRAIPDHATRRAAALRRPQGRRRSR